jgi:hypothetical protein
MFSQLQIFLGNQTVRLASGWFVLREKYYRLVAEPDEHGEYF